MTIVRSIVRPIVRAIVSAIVPAAAGGGEPAELVVNGGFDADTDWTKGTGWSIAGGVATQDGSDMYANLDSTLVEPTSVDGQYALSLDVVDASNLGFAIFLLPAVGDGYQIYGNTGTGPYAAPIDLTGQPAFVGIRVTSTDGVGSGPYSVDNISLTPL
jgi:hypothetical protein